jgi:hypothetical protein
MKVVFADQEIHMDYELGEEPYIGFGNGNDIDFLYSLAKDTLTEDESNDNKDGIIRISRMPQSLSKKDVQYMLEQRSRLSAFKWDRTRLGLNTANEKFSYEFSVPLFSLDHEKAIVVVEYLCPGLCGNGSVILYTKKNNKWESQSVNGWYH